jgi:hypothetical protein
MTRRREPDIDFDLMMSNQGVTRMDEREAQRKGKPGAVLRAAGPEPVAAAAATALDATQRALLEKARDELRRLTAVAQAAERQAAEQPKAKASAATSAPSARQPRSRNNIIRASPPSASCSTTATPC